jgi:superfamily II DNA or RNA helicase
LRTVFLQQLGRGLRLHEDKECLTVLDFIGQAHENYNFEARFRALSADPTRNVGDEIEHGFCHLPAGCVISLERVAREYVLENIRQAIVKTGIA